MISEDGWWLPRIRDMSRFTSTQLLALGGGGAVGALARYGLDQVAAIFPFAGTYLPWSTVLVNLVGALALGFFTAWLGENTKVPHATTYLAALGTGFCGAFTTYSAFTLTLAQNLTATAWMGALTEGVILVTVGIFCVGLGYVAGKKVSGGPQ